MTWHQESTPDKGHLGCIPCCALLVCNKLVGYTFSQTIIRKLFGICWNFVISFWCYDCPITDTASYWSSGLGNIISYELQKTESIIWSIQLCHIIWRWGLLSQCWKSINVTTCVVSTSIIVSVIIVVTHINASYQTLLQHFRADLARTCYPWRVEGSNIMVSHAMWKKTRPQFFVYWVSRAIFFTRHGRPWWNRKTHDLCRIARWLLD